MSEGGTENVVRGLVPRWGRGGAWQNPPRQLSVPSHNSSISNLGVPNCRPMSEGGTENVVRGLVPRWGRGGAWQNPSRQLSVPSHNSGISNLSVPNCRPMSEGGTENVVRGLVPRWGRGGAWQNPSRQLSVPSHNSSFSYLGAPAAAGMSDCYESTSLTPIRDRPLRRPLSGSASETQSETRQPAKRSDGQLKMHIRRRSFRTNPTPAVISGAAGTGNTVTAQGLPATTHPSDRLN